MHTGRAPALAILILCCLAALGQARSAKRGIAYGEHSAADFAALSPGLTWWYNWYYEPDAAVKSTYRAYGMEYVPMAWSGATDTGRIASYLATDAEVQFLLGYNEPNFLSQANMTPRQAAARWPTLEALATRYGLKLVSPAVNYCGDCVSENGVTHADPVVYLDSFFAACRTCTVDAIAVHWYACSADALTWYLDKFRKYGKPIWLTEFACWEGTPTLADQESYLARAVDILENDTGVFRYAWFTGRSTGPFISLFTSVSGELSALGELYVAMPVHDTAVFVDVPARIEAESYGRMSGVGLQPTQDTSGMLNVGWFDAGDWLEYGIRVPQAGQYGLLLRTAGTGAGRVQVLVDGSPLLTVDIPATGAWQTWQTVASQITLPQGQHRLRLVAVQPSFNLNWLAVTGGQAVDLPQAHGAVGSSTELAGSGAATLYDPIGRVVRRPHGDALLPQGLSAGAYLLREAGTGRQAMRTVVVP